jgi:hypothetical protein
MTMVILFMFHSFNINSCISLVTPGSSAPNGSSSNRIFGSQMTDCAINRRCCIPPESYIDSVWPINLPPALERIQDLKRSPEFLDMERRILDRIRATSGLHKDLDALRRLTRPTTQHA